MTHRPFEAIIFDHDGTLIDTETPDFLAWEMLYQEHDLTLTVDHWADMAVGHMEGYKRLFAELIEQSERQDVTPQTLRKRLEHFWPITLEQAALLPGVAQTLPLLQAGGYPLAVATASDQAWASRWLGHFALDSYFQVIATSDNVTHNKPAPDVYHYAAEQLGVAPERCLVFEDSLAGLRAAKAAGMTVVAVPNQVTKSLDFSAADRIISGLDQVTLAWLDSWREA